MSALFIHTGSTLIGYTLGCLLSYQSEYLVARNRIQICMMSRVKRKNLQVLLGHMQSNLKRLH